MLARHSLKRLQWSASLAQPFPPHGFCPSTFLAGAGESHSLIVQGREAPGSLPKLGPEHSMRAPAWIISLSCQGVGYLVMSSPPRL